MSMPQVIVKRSVLAIPTVLAVVTLIFLLIHMTPGDPVYFFSGEIGTTPEYIAFLREKYGLDQPLHVQYFTYVGHLLRGDLGSSIYFKKPVSELIFETLPATLLLVGGATLFSIVAGILLGVLAARKPNSTTDRIVSAFSLIGYAMPIFWTGQLLLLLFASNLSWLPTGGMMTVKTELTGLAKMADIIWHLILPACTLGFIQSAIVAQMTRTGLLEALSKNFITAAKARGVSKKIILFRHALRPALTVVVTVVGLNIGRVIAGAILTETTFSWPGLGRLLWRAVSIRDYPLLLGIIIFVSCTVLILNLFVDVIYAFIDPRVRYK